MEARNAMMALPAGAGMASHLLQLTCGSKHLLPEVFPQVPHIGWFNLRSERADQALLNDLATWTPSIEAGWVKLIGDNPRQLRLGAELSFGHGEMILALAVTKVLAREANQLLQPKVPRSQWADIPIADLVDSDAHVLRASDTHYGSVHHPDRSQWCTNHSGCRHLRCP
ncbi:MAG: hypothetical protein JO364_01500 [Pseudonocardiales bacterium]|nr:hypothetical protein [Pseudonocardiales bacterium]